MASFGKLQHWVFTLATVTLIIPIFIIEYRVMAETSGVFGYPMDDAYIHMAIAKNLAFHQVWGISQHQFVSASSSILYPLLLAGIFIVTGPHTIIPFMLNLIVAIIFIKVVQTWLRKQGLSPLHQLLVLFSAILLIPLPIIVIIGMEHTLQLLFCFLFISSFSDWLSATTNHPQPTWILPWKVFVYGALITATRYEGMFLLFTACLILIYYRQIQLSFELAVISCMPVIIFGIISMYNENYFLPNSVLLKSTPIPLTVNGMQTFFTNGIFQKLYYSTASFGNTALKYLLVILPATYLLLQTKLVKKEQYSIPIILLTTTVLLQIIFTSSGWFFRYEAYLVGISVIIIGLLLAKYGKEIMAKTTRPTKWVMLFFMLLIAFPSILRTRAAFAYTHHSCLNVYDHDYNVGKFLHNYYDSTVVAMNDIGAISYYTSAKNLDLWGLGNIEIARSMRDHYNSTFFYDTVIKTQSAKIAVLFDQMNDQQLLQKWKKVATWHINNVVIPVGANLSFYAIDSTMASRLEKNLRSYQVFLSSHTKVKYY